MSETGIGFHDYRVAVDRPPADTIGGSMYSHLTRPNRRRCRSARLLALLVTVAAAMAPQGTATAAVPGYQHVTATKISPITGVQAFCPPGKVALGAGGFQDDLDSGQLKLSSVQVGGSQVTNATISKDQDGYTGNWKVGATAVCAAAPLGYEIRTASFTRRSTDPTSSLLGSVSCPAGKKVLSSGATLVSTFGQVALSMVGGVTSTGDAGFALAVEDQDGFSGTWQLEVNVVCAQPLPGYQVITRNSPTSSTDKALITFCPIGKLLTGSGAQVNVAPFGFSVTGQVVLNDMRPVDTTTPHTLVTAMEDQDGFSSDWFLTGYSVCVSA
ncbi:MAG: hypothetical protein ACRCYU_02130 [Nocardioides sp.]